MTDTFPTQDTPPSSSKRRGRHCAAFSCANSYYDAKGNATGLHFFSFPKDVQRRNRWCNLIKRQHGKDGFFVTKSTFLCSEHFRKEDIRKTLSGRWELVKDFTLWPFWADTHVSQPFTKKRNGTVEDRSGYRIKLYDEALNLLEYLKTKGVCIAAASRTEDPPAARELLRVLDIDKYFTYKEIYPGSKISHFKKFTELSGVPYSEMLFFDDEERNIYEINRLGVTSILVTSGINQSVLKNGLQSFLDKKYPNNKLP